jgi:putative transposase
MMERINKELRPRAKVVGVFPNEGSLLWLVGSIRLDINEEWVPGRSYLTMEKEWSSKETGFRQITQDLRHYLAK